MYDKKTIAEVRRHAKAHGVRALLSRPGANPKTSKAAIVDGVYSLPLHLAPERLSGWNVCPMATDGCKAACLHTAGNKAHMPQKERSRLARTRYYFEHRQHFDVLLWAELAKLERQADAAGLAPSARLDATSDLGIAVRWDHADVMPATAFPRVMFYDYTKVWSRYERFLAGDYPPNYHLTFSLAEHNADRAATYLRHGGTVAAIFRKAGGGLPESWRGFPVIDGDASDYRPKDPKGHVVGLKPKGAAKADTSGFVVDVA